MIQAGKHLLSGIDTSICNGETSYLFCLDGITYEAAEDPCDGYRSWATINETDKKCRFKFPPQEVIAIEIGVENSLILYDAINGKLVLKIETDYFDSYYPCAVFEYHPENLNINKDK